MCYHAATPKKQDLAKVLPAEVSIQDYKPHYHASGFAHPELPVMTAQEPQYVQPVTWGLVPYWTKTLNEALGTRNKTLNARAETIFTTPMFRSYAPRQRCLIFVSGFFEWKHEGKEKIPHFIFMPNHLPFALAGLYATWRNPATQHEIMSCSIITTEADELMASIHNSKKRMPLILPKQKWSQWLNDKLPQTEIAPLLLPYDEGLLQAHEVSKMVSSQIADTDIPGIQIPVRNSLF